MADKQIYELPELTAPADNDAVLASDTSESHAPKRLLLSKLRDLVNNTNCIDATGPNLKLKTNMDGNNKRLTNLADGTGDHDALTVGQVRDLLTDELPALPAPTVVQGASALVFRAQRAVPEFVNYYFYYCISAEESVSLSVVGGAVVPNVEAGVVEVASANNTATIVREAGMLGMYVHVAVRYGNLRAMSDLSPTRSVQITAQGLPDFVAPSFSLDVPTGQIVGNRLVVSAPTAGPGVHYVLTILFNSQESYSITGSEAELVRLSSAVPNFSYDITLAQSSAQYAHYSLTAVPLIGESKTRMGASLALNIEDMFSDQLITLLAGRIADKLVTQTDEPLKLKGV